MVWGLEEARLLRKLQGPGGDGKTSACQCFEGSAPRDGDSVSGKRHVELFKCIFFNAWMQQKLSDLRCVGAEIPEIEGGSQNQCF